MYQNSLAKLMFSSSLPCKRTFLVVRNWLQYALAGTHVLLIHWKENELLLESQAVAMDLRDFINIFLPQYDPFNCLTWQRHVLLSFQYRVHGMFFMAQKLITEPSIHDFKMVLKVDIAFIFTECKSELLPDWEMFSMKSYGN